VLLTMFEATSAVNLPTKRIGNDESSFLA